MQSIVFVIAILCSTTHHVLLNLKLRSNCEKGLFHDCRIIHTRECVCVVLYVYKQSLTVYSQRKAFVLLKQRKNCKQFKTDKNWQKLTDSTRITITKEVSKEVWHPIRSMVNTYFCHQCLSRILDVLVAWYWWKIICESIEKSAS